LARLDEQHPLGLAVSSPVNGSAIAFYVLCGIKWITSKRAKREKTMQYLKKLGEMVDGPIEKR
jgi:hypothetical protein